ncbi:ndufs1 NADH-ubiquinone oxidoreductase subunit, partial [Coemansia sp. RSA 2603]
SAEFVYLLGADGEGITQPGAIPANAFVVYQGHHGDAGAHLADVILPGSAYTEKTATYVNTEGRAQLTRRAVNPPGAARDDWKIVRALSEAAGLTLPYDDVSALRARMADVCPTLVHIDECEKTSADVAKLGLKMMREGGRGKAQGLLPRAVGDYYMTDAISRASRTMARASAAAAEARSSGLIPELESPAQQAAA